MKIKCHARLNLVQTDCQFFLEKYLGSAGKELSYPTPEMISVCEEEKILRKYIVKYYSTTAPLQKKIHTIYTSSIKILHLHESQRTIFLVFQ